MPSLSVKPELGPTLPQLLDPHWRRLPRPARVAAVVLAVLVLAAAAALVLRGGAGEVAIVVEEPIAFNLRRGEALERVDPRPRELLRLEQTRDGRRLQSFAVSPLTLPAYRGVSSGAYPVFAERVIAGLRRRFADFELADEGRVRLNEVPGYAIGFRARENGERVWGRVVLLVPETDPPTPVRDGVRLDLLAARGSGVANPDDVGARGQAKLPYRSFRFGTEAP